MSHNINLTGVLSAERLAQGNLTVCFTGPRPKNLHGYVRDAYRPIVVTTTEVCKALVDCGVRHFISGGAQGFDQLAFWAVHALRSDDPTLTNTVYIPFPKQPNLWSEEGPFSQADYAIMLRKATAVKTLADDPVDTAQAVKRLHGRNHAMLRDSDLVVALLADRSLNWNTAKGGTAECVRAAFYTHKPVLAIEYRPSAEEKFRLNWILP